MSDLTKAMLAFFVIAMCGDRPEYRAIGWLAVLVGIVIEATVAIIKAVVAT